MEKGMLIGVFLLIGTVYDLKYKQVPANLFLIFGSIAAFGVIVGIWNNQWDCLAGCVPGLLFLIISRVSGEQIGYGDSLAYTIVGALSSPADIVYMILLSLVLASVVSGAVFIVRRVGRQFSIPFYPMILIAYLCRCIGSMESW